MASIPDLRVRHKSVEGIARFDLRRFLFAAPRGANGKALSAHWFLRRIERANREPDKIDRLELILAIREYMETRLVGGYSLRGVETYLSCLQYFFNYFDQNGRSVRLDNLEESYLEYSEHLFHEYNQTPPRLKRTTAYQYAAALSSMFGDILELTEAVDLIYRTRLKPSVHEIRAVSRQADKQNLEDTTKMGRVLIDLVSGITVDAVLGALPLRVPIRSGLVENNEIVINFLPTSSTTELILSPPVDGLHEVDDKLAKQLRPACKPTDTIEGTRRWFFFHLRVVAEFLIFIAQTGMNVAEAKSLQRRQFKYKAIGDSWQVRAYKTRRGGEVIFPVYKSYKSHLREYLGFLEHFCAESDLLFPRCGSDGNVSTPTALFHASLRRLLIRNNVPWIPPRVIRKTRVNWCLRRSGGDAGLTAEMHQHLQETLRDKYDNPSQQTSMVEVTRFWRAFDPIKYNDLKDSVIAGSCNGQPEPTEHKPAEVVSPNCSSQSGCLWCKNLRDIDSIDYIWSLASFLRVKRIEAAGAATKDTIPADMVVARIVEKISWFRQSSLERAGWVEEAEMRVAEGDYHPHWSGILEFLEH